MQVVVPSEVKAALRTFDDQERRRVEAWLFTYLKNWDTDPLTRDHARNISHDTYSFDTSDDIRIFFTVNELKKEIVVLALARPSRFDPARFATATAASE